jgi:hypothetical protein
MSTWLRELYELVAWGEPHDWESPPSVATSSLAPSLPPAGSLAAAEGFPSM